MISGKSEGIPCKNGNIGSITFSGVVTIKCLDGVVKTLSGGCYKDCHGRTELFQSVFEHGLMTHNTMIQMNCPASGVVTLLCLDSEVSNYKSECFRSCRGPGLYEQIFDAEGKAIPNEVLGEANAQRAVITLKDDRMIRIFWDDPIPHQQLFPAQCDPSLSSGTADIICEDGTPRIKASNCYLNCEEGSIIQPDEDQLYSFQIVLKHGYLKHGETQSVNCPTMLAGRVTVKCQDSEVVIDSGSCGTSNCMPSSSPAGEGLLVEYPQLNHGEIYQTPCGEGFMGDIKFRCEEGVAIREWIRLQFIDITGDVTTVELCECCLDTGISKEIRGSGQANLSQSLWSQARGAWIGIQLFVLSKTV